MIVNPLSLGWAISSEIATTIPEYALPSTTILLDSTGGRCNAMHNAITINKIEQHFMSLKLSKSQATGTKQLVKMYRM